jgi:hypothetical protein
MRLDFFLLGANIKGVGRSSRVRTPDLSLNLGLVRNRWRLRIALTAGWRNRTLAEVRL